MFNKQKSSGKRVLVIGSGMGSLSTACLLAKEGFEVVVLEQNYLPGGCTSSYWRKGFVFEAGATTLVGLDTGMPLHYLCQQLGISLPAVPLELPMRVRLPNGRWINKPKSLDAWISEAEACFGKQGQRQFWIFCAKIADFVWQTSIRQRRFPPGRLSDLAWAIQHTDLKQIINSRWALSTIQDLLKKHGLHGNDLFKAYINEQLLITAQNTAEEVNVLFGSTALCYTQSTNYYMPGGLMGMVQPFVSYLESNGGSLLLRHEVKEISYDGHQYHLQTSKHGSFAANFLVSGIPLNNFQELAGKGFNFRKQNSIMPSERLNSAFQMGIAFRSSEGTSLQAKDCLHYQLHLDRKISGLNSGSLFISLSHPDDQSRSDAPGQTVASVSTHVHHPEQHLSWDKKETEDAVLDFLAELGFFQRQDVVYYHSSTPAAWEKWTGRKWGFVGGYPQFKSIMPWQMADSRLDGHKAYLVGDTAYPGQGIPGVTLGGIIAFEKLLADWF
jgi:C-3',4' desaturase CrtD